FFFVASVLSCACLSYLFYWLSSLFSLMKVPFLIQRTYPCGYGLPPAVEIVLPANIKPSTQVTAPFLKALMIHQSFCWPNETWNYVIDGIGKSKTRPLV